MNVTQQMIADRVGVTRATVSMALRNDPQISSKRRDEILKTAEEMGYRPNAMVSSLMSHIRKSKPVPRRSGLLYLLSGVNPLPDVSDNTPGLCFKGAADQASKMGFHLEALWIREPGMTEKRMQGILRNRGISGVIVGPREDEMPLPHLCWGQLSSVMISHSFSEPGLDRVYTNFINSTKLALNEIRRTFEGPVRLVLPYEHDRNVNHLWASSYRQEQVDQKNLRDPLIYSDPSEVTEWIRDKSETLILGTIPVLDALISAGFCRGRDFEFVSLNVENRRDVSGVRESSWEVGAEAANQVIAKILMNQKGLPQRPHITLVEPGWQEGYVEKRM